MARGYGDVSGAPQEATDARRFYEHYWEAHADNAIWGPGNRHVRRIVKNLLDGIEYRSVLDVGCGVGVLLKELKEARPDLIVHGLDVSAEAIEAASKFVEGDFRACDVTAGLPDITVDVAVCCEVLEHLPDDAAVLRELGQRCRYVVLEVPAGPLTRAYRQGGHLRHYRVRELREVLARTGYDVLALRRWGFPLFSIFRRIMDAVPETYVYGSYSWGRKLLCQLLYWAYYLNCFNAGDCLFALARSTAQLPGGAEAHADENAPSR